ncbi:MAG TPA: hypothetical protein VFY15_00210 [Acidimicrobiia bacterium]|nr:hypothetical protein [Acidimicrobiia bacterium]
MSAIAGGLVLAAVLVVMVLAFTWQGWRRRQDPDPLYVLDDAAAYAHARLEAATRQRVDRRDVRRILEWQLEYHQVVAPRTGEVAVVGSGDAISHVLERAAESAMALEARDVAEVIAADVEYLVSIGAVGTPAEDPAG